MTTSETAETAPYVVLVLQGGGARGAYQAGVYDAMSAAGLEPDWVCGISSGALNAAAIACHQKDDRVAALDALWQKLALPYEPALGLPPQLARLARAGASMMTTVAKPHFYRPRPLPPTMYPPGSPGATSLYTDDPLRRTLESIIDFDAYNARPHEERCRLTLGATSVKEGTLHFFDSRHIAIDARHPMASGALPPGSPGVVIGDDAYWDGGVVANSPLEPVLRGLLDDAKLAARPIMMVVVDLWSGSGALPQNLPEVMWRKDQITYESFMQRSLEQFVDRLWGAGLGLLSAALGEQVLPKKAQEALRHQLLELAPTDRLPRGALALDRLRILRLEFTHTDDIVPLGPMDFAPGALQRRRTAGRRSMETLLAASDWKTFGTHDDPCGREYFIKDGTVLGPADVPLPAGLMRKLGRKIATETASEIKAVGDQVTKKK